MPKIHLIIADIEEDYVDAISNYLLNNHSDKFKISFFTNQKFLIDYIDNSKEQINALLIHPNLYSNLIPKEKINTLILLTDKGELEEVEEKSKIPIINKYQSGKNFANNILNILAEKDSKIKYSFSDRGNDTKVIAVYSPCGGVGKTSIAVGCSYLSSERGKNIFYLNLEDYQSTSLFFKNNREGTLSEVLYYIKDKKKNIELKIESITNEDFKSKVKYFSPPESVLDLNEVSSDELIFLINQIKSTKDYDVVYVDMSSKLDEKNISILMEVDEILLIGEDTEICRGKLETMIYNLKIISNRKNIDILHKSILVLNKYDSRREYSFGNIDIGEKGIQFKIPFIEETFIGGKTLNSNPQFASAIWDLLDNILI